jgi:signal transduction histidine kinase
MSRQESLARLGIVSGAIFLAFALLLTVLVFSQGLSYYNASEILGYDARVEHSYKVLSKIDEIATNLKAAESAARGYLVQPSPMASQELIDSSAAVRLALGDLKTLTADNSFQQTQIAKLADPVDRRLDVFEGFVRYRQGHDLKSFQSHVDRKTVKALRLEVTDRLAKVRSEEDRLLAERTTHFQRSVQRARVSFWVAAVIGLVALFRFFALASRMLDQYRNREMVEAARAHELEEKVRERTAELQEANEDMKSFSYSVAHDLRSPLNAIHGFSQILMVKMGSEPLEESRSNLQLILNASERMRGIIEGLLTLARLTDSPVRRISLDMSSLVKNTLQTIITEKQAKPPIIEVEPDLQAVADSSLVSILLINLLGNAVKFSGRVESPVVRVSVTHENGESVFQINDNGVGFDQTYADKLFRPFQRMHSMKEFEGTGLGLAICAKIVKRHGGRIWIQSEPGQGMTVFFTLAAVGSASEVVAA